MRYTAYGLVLASSTPLPELPRAHAGRAAFRIRLASGRRGALSPRPFTEPGWRWLQPRPRRRAGAWVAVGVRRGKYRLIFDGRADFIVDPARRAILINGSRLTEATRHRLLDQVVPIVMSHFGRLVLHASAVEASGGAIAFAGPAGAGKSTLAASFARAGAAVLADDALVIEERRAIWRAVPSYAGVRLWRGAGKVRIAERDGVAFAARPLPLRRIYLVERPPTRRSAPRIEAIPPREAIMSLLEYAFILDTEDRARIGAHFNRVASAAATLDIRRLVCPERAGAADALRELVRADAAEHR